MTQNLQERTANEQICWMDALPGQVPRYNLFTRTQVWPGGLLPLEHLLRTVTGSSGILTRWPEAREKPEKSRSQPRPRFEQHCCSAWHTTQTTHNRTRSPWTGTQLMFMLQVASSCEANHIYAKLTYWTHRHKTESNFQSYIHEIKACERSIIYEYMQLLAEQTVISEM